MTIEKNWFVFRDDHHLGPFSKQDLIHLLDKNEMGENELIWAEGEFKWRPLKEVAIFEGQLTPPPLPEPSPLESLPSLPFESELIPGPEIVFSSSSSSSSSLLFKTIFISTFVFSTLFFILYMAGSFQSQKFSWKGLPLSERGSFERVISSPLGSRPRLRWFLLQDFKGLYIASNDSSLDRIYLILKSLKGETLSTQKMIATSESSFKNGLAYFNKFVMNKGSSLHPGRYEVILYAQKEASDEKAPFYKGEILLFKGGKAQFKSHLKRFHKSIREEKIRHLRERRERYRSFLALLKKTMALYGRVSHKFSIGSFKKVYNKSIGLHLKGLIRNNHRLSLSLVNENLEMSRYYKNLAGFGKKIRALVSVMVIKTPQIYGQKLKSLKKLKNTQIRKGQKLKREGKFSLKSLDKLIRYYNTSIKAER